MASSQGINPLGFLLPAAVIGLQAIEIRPVQRGIFTPDASAPIIAQATLEEQHIDELEITDHPVEQSAAITDHAFKRPAMLVLRLGWSDSASGPVGLDNQAITAAAALLGQPAPLIAAIPATVGGIQSLQAQLTGNAVNQARDVYQKLLKLQSERVLFSVNTGKRSYTNLLLKALSTSTDHRTEHALFITMVCRQLIITTTQVVSVSTDPSVQSQPQKTAPPQNQGNKQLQPAPYFTP